jgi:hypothetical protein
MGSVEPESARVVATARRRSASDIGVISELKVALVPPLNRTEFTQPPHFFTVGLDQISAAGPCSFAAAFRSLCCKNTTDT